MEFPGFWKIGSKWNADGMQRNVSFDAAVEQMHPHRMETVSPG
jgi:hypothetical protein